MNNSIPVTSSLQENTIFLSCPLASKEEFVKQYRRLYNEKAKAEELYLLILTELEKAVLECDLDHFKKLSNLIDYISEIEDQTTLNDFYSNSKNSLRSTNFVILACKHNKVKILEYLFENSNKFINNISFGLRSSVIKPQDEDEAGHNAFYYAIRSGNIDLLNTLCNKWPGDYFSACHGKLDEILSKAYENLKLKNVPLSEEIEIFVESKLIDLRFFSDVSRNAQSAKTNPTKIKERIGLVLDNIYLLKEEHSNSKEVNGKFLFIAKFVAQNIHILKRQLKSTYNRLPWEEIEFYLVSFVSSYMKPQEINLFYRSAFNKENVLSYLANFAKRLEDEKCSLDNIQIDKLAKDEKDNIKINNLAKLPKLQRMKVVADIISSYPEFEDLYNGYQQIRDVYSLEKIHDCVKLASSANPEDKEGQLIIIRGLQVIGEFLKNTLESPNLSNTTSELLLLSFPKNTRKIITKLRDSLSHADSLSKIIETDTNTNSKFFTSIQNDTKKVGDVVTDMLYSYKVKMIRILLEKIVASKNFDEIQDIPEILSNVDLNKMPPENFIIMEHKKLEKLVVELNDTITDKTIYEEDLFSKIYSIISSTKTKSENIKTEYNKGFAFLKVLGIVWSGNRIDHNIIRGKKFLANKMLQYISPQIECNKLKEIAELSKKILCSAASRMQHDNLDKLTRLTYNIFHIIEFETGDIKWINELSKKLDRRSFDMPAHKNRKFYSVSEGEHNKQFTLKLSELKNSLRCNMISDKSIENLQHYKSDKKLQAIVEMHVLDIMSILEGSQILGYNQLFLYDYTPTLTGICLRNHIAHNNALVNLLLSDTSIPVILNAEKLISENILENKKTLGKFVKDDPSKLKDRHSQNFITVTNQERMFSAVEEGNLDDLKCCLKKGADINARSIIKSWTSLHFAAKGPSLDVMKFILDQNLDVNAKDVNGQTLFHIAAAYGRINILEFLEIETDLPVDGKDKRGKTPLHFAAQNGHKDVVEFLINSKANTSARYFAFFSPLHYAVINNHIDVAKILLSREVHVDFNTAMGGYTPLHLAAENGHLELVNFLLKNGANVNERNDNGCIPLHTAALNGHLEVVCVLILNGTDINSRGIDGCTPLHYAVENGHGKIANILLKHGANVNVGDITYNNTPLQYAAEDGHEEIVKTLLKNKANACIATVDGITPLHLAVLSGHLNIITALLKHGVDICTKDKTNNSVLHYAAKNGDKVVAELLISNGAQINARNNDKLTPLHVAAEEGHWNFTYLLITHKADVKARDSMGNTPLHTAAMNDRKEIIDLLIKNEADINARNNDGMTPLHFAALNGQKDVVSYLLKSRAKVNCKTNDCLTPLLAAVVRGHKDIVNLLTENGAFVNPREITDFTPLHMAVEVGQKEIVEALIAKGANVNVQNNYLTPLLSAVKHNNKEIVKILIAKGANVNAEDNQALYLAVLAGYRDIVEILLKKGANVKTKSTENETPLHLAAKRGHSEIVKALVTRGADVNASTINNVTPLSLAVQEGHEEVVKVLITNGASVNVKSSDGTTPLHFAASNGLINVVKVLLDNEVNVTVKDNKNRIPLELAVAHGHLQVVKMLLEYKKIDMNTKGNDDWTILHIASQENNLEMVKYLVNEGSDINARNSLHSKPIHIAAREGHIDTVEFFLNKGSNINDPGAYNQTLLHYAALYGHFNVVKYLITQGADVNVKDVNGITPIYFAAKFGSKNIIELLLENGADYNIHDKIFTKLVKEVRDQNALDLLLSTKKLFDAVKNNNFSDVETYLKEGAYVNAKSYAGGMPIHYAAWKGYEDIVNILLQYKANPNAICKSPLHYAAKFSHLKIVKALLSNGAIYNVVSDSGKTPSDFSVDRSITKLFKLLRESFENIEKGNSNVINELNRINDFGTIKAIMRACNRENKTLIVAAIHSNFSRIEELKQISQPDTSTKVNKGLSFMIQGNYQEAFNIFKSAFMKRKEILGPNNPGTLDIQTHMAKALYKQGAYQEALNMLETIFQKQKEILGLNDKDTLNTRSMIALVLHRQGKDNDSSDVYQEVFQKQKEILGPNHPDTLNTQFHMALVLDRQGKYEEALNINRTIFEIQKSTLGALDPNTISAQNNIAMVLCNQGKNEEALKIYKEVFEKKKIVLGYNHSDTLRTFQSIASIFFKQSKYDEALEAYQKVLATQKIVLGKNHPESLDTQYYLANVFFAQGKYNMAFKAYSEVFDQIKAVYGSNHQVVLDISAKINMINEKFKFLGRNPSNIFQHLQKDIHIAASNGDLQIVQGLLKDGADANDKDIEGRTPLHYAVSRGHVDTVSLLLNNGAIVNEKDMEGRTPLHYAVSSGHVHTVSILLNNGADVTLVTNKGNTPLHIATSKGHIEIIVNLLQCVSHDKLNDFINAKTTSSGTTSLHIAAQNGSLEIMMSLLKHGASYNIKNKDGKMALEFSKHQNIVDFLELVEKLFEDAKRGTLEIITKLEVVKPEEFSAIVNARNDQGNTLLQVAIINKHTIISRKLLEMLKSPDQNL